MAWLPKGAPIPTKGRGSKLSAKMRRFVDEYMVDLVAHKAVVRAGYKTSKRRNAAVMAADLLHHPLVSREIEARMKEKQERNELTADYVLQKLVVMLEDNEKVNPNTAVRCAELLGKNLGLFKERTEISGPDGGAIEMEQRTKQAVNDFTNKLKRLQNIASNETGNDVPGGTGAVAQFPKRQGEGGA